MHDKVLLLSDDDDLSDCEENPLIEEVEFFERKRGPSSSASMRHRVLFFTIVFLVLLSVHILIFNNVKMYSRREVQGWSQNQSRLTTDYILPNENTTLIEPPALCRNENEPIFLLIVVCSSASNFEARQSIRESWGNTTEYNYPTFERLHGSRNGSFLGVNSNKWKQYVEVGATTASHDNQIFSAFSSLQNATNSSQILGASNIRSRVVFLGKRF